MGSEDAEHTRFPCLATVRSLLAAVVTVLAVAVVVMVIVVLNRPEDFILSMSRGYIQSEELWWTETVKTIRVHQFGAAVGGRGARLPSPYDRDVGSFDPPEFDDGDYGYGYVGHAPKVVTVTTYAPATQPVNLRVTVSVYNPSGRGPIECYVTAIRVFDMPNASATGMEIGAVITSQNFHFSVPSKAWHTETKRVAISNSNTLQYIYSQYQGKDTFLAMVQVTATSTSKFTHNSWATSKPTPISEAIGDSYYCSAVPVVHGKPDEAAIHNVPCTIYHPEVPPTPSPAPAPAPAGT